MGLIITKNGRADKLTDLTGMYIVHWMVFKDIAKIVVLNLFNCKLYVLCTI